MAWEKLDDTLVAEDTSTAALIPGRIRANIAEDATDRHVRASCVYSQRSSGDYLPNFSTPEDADRAIALLLPAYPGASSLALSIAYTLDDADMDVHAMCDGVEGAVSTLTATGSIAQATVSCDVPARARGDYWRCGLVFRSTRGASVTAVDLLDATDGHRFYVDSTAPLSGGRHHYSLVLDTLTDADADTARTIFHVPRVDDLASPVDPIATATDVLHVWPHATQPNQLARAGSGKTDSGELFDLAAMTLYGFSAALSGSVTPTADAGGLGAGQAIRAMGPNLLQIQIDALYNDRLWCLCLGSALEANGEQGHGVVFDAESAPVTIAQVAVEHRADVRGLRAAILWLPLETHIGAERVTAAATLSIAPWGGAGSSESVTVHQPVIEAATTPEAGSAAVYAAQAGRDVWGAADLERPDLIRELPITTAAIDHPGSVGDRYTAGVALTGCKGIVLAVTIHEVA